MIVLDPILTILLVILWLAGVVWCTVRYLQAWRARRTLEKWVWFILWCFFVMFTEWVVYFGSIAFCQVTGRMC
jgi:hypothetical protein